MPLKIQSITGNISFIECVGSSYRKSFTIYNTEQPGTFTDFILKLTPESECFDNFKLFSGTISTSGTDWEISVSIEGEQYFTFSVICDNVETGRTAYLHTSGINILNNEDDVLFGFFPSVLTFTSNNPGYAGKREIGSILAVDSEDNQIISQISRKITSDSSFGLIRTNPKLTGNIKLTIDSNNDMWLNSIDASKDLSADKFKKYRINSNSSYAIDLKNFFDGGTTPPETVFSLYQADTQYTSTKRQLSEQYDRFYQYGVEQLVSKFYDEDFSFFAPLYLKEEIPDYFVIFRTTGPISALSYNDSMKNWASGLTSEILNNSVIVKTFNLTETSQIGKYLRNLINHPARKPSEMTVSFQTDGYTSFNGISYREGSFAQKGELLYDYYQQENPILSTEEFLTLGFERNKIISSNIINLEFLFNDDDAEQYSINRYFGLYVNAIELANFEFDENGFVQYSRQIGQTPFPRKGVDATKTSLAPFIQNNDNGIKIYANSSSVNAGITPNIFTSKIYSIEGSGPYTIKFPGNIENRISIGETCTLITSSDARLDIEVEEVSYSNDFTNVLTNSAIGLYVSAIKADFYKADKLKAASLKLFDNAFIENSARLFYIKDREDFLHNIKSTTIVQASIDAFTVEDMLEISLFDKTLDLTKFTGFSDIITQTPGTLLPKGKSSMCLSVNQYFQPNDYIEINWDNGPFTGGYPLRWRIIANTNSLLPGESWPSYGINSDTEGEYYFSYFHPGDSSIDIKTFVKSLSEAFGRFPFKNFEVLAKENNLYFRSTESGLSSEKTKLVFNMDTPAISVMGITAPNSGSVNFIGASDRNNVRSKINKTVAHGMVFDEYFSTEGNFSITKRYKIFQDTPFEQTILFAPYLEEPVYDETSEKLLDFIGSEFYNTIVLQNESQPFQLTYDRKITSYELFKPSYGILSIFPLRDFDTDFHSSDYSKSYTPELIEYFKGIGPVKVVSTSPLTFDQGITFSSYTDGVYCPFIILNDGSVPSTLMTQTQLKFDSPGLTADIVGASFLPTIGDSYLILPDNKSLYYTENELVKFKGFLSLSSIVTVQNEQQFQIYENLWNPRRFVFQNIDSEYNRLAENYLKTFCLKSRVVPYSCKWVFDGNDLRENPYRLNWSRAFGTMNFSPSQQTSADPKFHTHEWPYLDSIPQTFPLEYLEDSFSYMFEPLSSKYDFSSTKIDFFSLYFNTGFPSEQYFNGNEYVSANMNKSQKYSIFKYEDFSERTFTMFRGKKVEISNTENTQKYDGYRFSVIIKTEKCDFLNNEDPLGFNTTVNEKWKFIVVVITVKIANYRFPNGKISYTDLYTLDNCNTVASLVGTLGLPVYNVLLPNDYRLSDPLRLSGYSSNPEIFANEFYFDSYITSHTFFENLQEELIETTSGNFNRLCAFTESGSEISVSIPPPVSDEIRNTYLKLTDTSGIILINQKYTFASLSILGSLPTSVPWNSYIMYHEGGGDNAYLGIRNRLSFFEIANVMTEKSNKSQMTYDIYDMNGSHSSDRNFEFKMVSPETLVRKNDFNPVPDTDKPSLFLTVGDIGAVLETTNNLQTLYRYQGNFSPKFKDVLKFWLREDEEFTMTTLKDFMFCNTHFATNLSDFAILKNQYYNKVSPSEILSLSTNDGYSPVYPLINEISIDKKDQYVWSSSWDDNYYRTYSSTSDYEEICGTNSMKEIKSLLGSKCMKVPKQLDLHQFITDEYAIGENLQLSSKELTFIDNETTCKIRVNLYDRLLREMMGTTADLRAKTEFLRTIDIIPDSFNSTEIEAKVREYLIQNIVNLYEIQDVKLYVLQTGNSDIGQIATLDSQSIRPLIETTNVIINGENEKLSLDENSLFAKQYIMKKDVKITSINNMVFEVEYSLDSRYWTSLSIGVSVKRI